jgi:hypothetical protein
MFRRKFSHLGAAWLAVFTFIGCASPTAPSPDLQGGVLATFEVEGQRFKVFATNASAIEALLGLQGGQGMPSIPNGRIRHGAGAGNHNAPFGWHLDPEDLEIVALAIEVCDGTPSYVQAHMSDYIDDVGRYCPWGARLVNLQDYRH